MGGDCPDVASRTGLVTAVRAVAHIVVQARCGDALGTGETFEGVP